MVPQTVHFLSMSYKYMEGTKPARCTRGWWHGEPRGWQCAAPAACWALARAPRDIKISTNPQELFVVYLYLLLLKSSRYRTCMAIFLLSNI